MRRRILALLLILVAVQISQASAADRKVRVAILNPTINSGVYSFDVWAKNDSAGTTFFVGTSSLYFLYNQSALNSPSLTNINPKYTGQAGIDNYNPMTVQIVTLSGTNYIAVTITHTGANGGSSALSTATPDGERVCTINLNITNPNQTSQLSWDQVNTALLTTGPLSVHHVFIGGDNGLLPVQLASFTSRVINQQGHVRLDWRTASETNNLGFYVQKSQISNGNWQTVSELIPGHGTTLEPRNYTWTDLSGTGAGWYYRLKQVDLDGTEHFTEPIMPTGVTSVKEKELPKEFALKQNFPNPFNPSTQIEFALPKQSNVQLEVYNLLGQKVATLVDGVKDAGYHTVEFKANGFASGLYFYRMTADGSVNFLKKMVLMK